ncbi:hypothetical protein [Thaumasiovibrio subtropicus]|uniref:hypothetical protein n=1 Tax=Thaumasiovibrio subtropicus TaxID=1891207 RepID=UPI000B350C98|nr:hypothetical protein [Thaumasiovibrio subtropicus]
MLSLILSPGQFIQNKVAARADYRPVRMWVSLVTVVSTFVTLFVFGEYSRYLGELLIGLLVTYFITIGFIKLYTKVTFQIANSRFNIVYPHFALCVSYGVLASIVISVILTPVSLSLNNMVSMALWQLVMMLLPVSYIAIMIAETSVATFWQAFWRLVVGMLLTCVIITVVLFVPITYVVETYF